MFFQQIEKPLTVDFCSITKQVTSPPRGAMEKRDIIVKAPAYSPRTYDYFAVTTLFFEHNNPFNFFIQI